MTTHDDYRRDVSAMLEAAHAWRYVHPGDALEFRGIVPAGTLFIGPLERHVDRLAGNIATRDLLLTLVAVATRGGATIMMAEAVIRDVFGIDRALSKVRQ